MIVRFSANLVRDRLAALTFRVDGHASLPGKVRIYAGTMPASGGGSVGSSTLLAELTFPKPSYGGFALGVLTLLSPNPVLAQDTGTPSWARFLDGGNNYVMDADAGNPASLAAVKIANDTGGDVVYAGGTVSMTSVAIAEA